MRTPHRSIAACLVALCLLALGALPAYGQKLPFEVRETVRKSFPNATIRSCERETENGVRIYEVNLVRNGRRVEVEIDKFGGLGEVERNISIDEAPRDLIAALAKKTKNLQGARIERHERWGIARDGRFLALAKPRVFYDVKVTLNGRRKSIKWRADAAGQLPVEAQAAIAEAYPGAIITEVLARNADGVAYYDVRLVRKGLDIGMLILPDGTLVEVTTEAVAKELPAAVLATIRKVAGQSRVTSVQRSEARVVFEGEARTVLDAPQVAYRLTLRRRDLTGVCDVAEDGRQLTDVAWRSFVEDHHDDDDEDDDDDDDDDD